MPLTTQNSASLAHGVDTKIFSRNNLVKPQTVRKGYCNFGSYQGVIPTKLANGRLLWPDVIVTQRGTIAANDSSVVVRQIPAGAVLEAQ